MLYEVITAAAENAAFEVGRALANTINADRSLLTAA